MVRSSHKLNIILAVATIIGASASTLAPTNAQEQDVKLQVNLMESLEITVTDPDEWASGSLTKDAVGDGWTSDFLRNKVNVTAATNNGNGVRVSMYTHTSSAESTLANTTRLFNLTSYSASDATSYISTLDATSGTNVQPGANGANFPVNYWGYSIDDTPTLNTTSHYNPLATSANPITLINTNYGTAGASQDVYFGAKANNTKQSGTYAQTVYFAAVTGNIETDPTDPGYNPPVPVNPSNPNPVDDIAYHNINSTGNTTYTHTSYTSGTPSTTTPSVDGNTTTTSTHTTAGDARNTYAQAAGVTTESSTGAAVATALGVAAAVSAASGTFFFILAKRKKDDDEEEEG